MTSTVQFDDSDEQIDPVALDAIESELGLRFPNDMRALYLVSNGGVPDPYVYEDDLVDTVVAEFLPITSKVRRTAVDTFRHLVLGKKIVPENFFPIAVDGGGDYFFMDCSSADGAMYFYQSDGAAIGEGLVGLGVGVNAFLLRLKPE